MLLYFLFYLPLVSDIKDPKVDLHRAQPSELRDSSLELTSKSVPLPKDLFCEIGQIREIGTLVEFELIQDHVANHA